jgi:hypothetical protein
MFLLYGRTVVAHATPLVPESVPGEFVVLDTTTDLMWLKKANYAQTSSCASTGNTRREGDV